ncbi:tyrosine-type recombinase/integrase [Geofilum rubicundum]|uniref:tyrosine-type recombinase/integrase n=1 Tax=Geofilum rubicundum TaxID=472113 RepID=UPI00138E2DA6|nr:tyrosine-type recombinase/integrase [Geofilum rubicundum]
MSTYPVIHPNKERVAIGIGAGIKDHDLDFSHQRPIFEAFTESMILKRLSPVTRKIYLQGFKRFLSHHTGSDINKLCYGELLIFVKEQALLMHPTKLKQTISAIKFYYERTRGGDKMFFPLAKDKRASLFTLYLPFYDLKELLNGIDSPGDKLLLFLVYHANFKLRDICRLPKEVDGIFEHQFRLPGNDERAKQYFQELVSECNNQYRLNTYLIENKGQAHSLSTLKRKVFRVLSHYRLADIYRKQYQQILKRTDYSVRTRAMYLNAFMKFLKHFNYKHPVFITDGDIRTYIALHRKNSSAHLNTMISSFKFFFDKVHKLPVSPQILVRPRNDLHVSEYFSESEMAAMLGTTDYLKHKLLLELRCISSLRQQEIQNLRLVDIDFKRNRLFLKATEGKRNRYSLFSQHLNDLLRTYLAVHKPKTFLFEGHRPGMKCSITNMSAIFKNMAKAAGIQRRGHKQMLRHSFTTQSPEGNKDIVYRQEMPLPGYESIKASERYTHFSGGALLNMKSPSGRPGVQTSFKANRNHSPP